MKQHRRVSPRIPYEETVSLTRIDGGGRLFGRSVNLGLAGMYVVCVEPCEIGTELVCSLLLPGGPRKVLARVTRLTALVRGVGIALVFHDTTTRDRAAIEALMAAHRREVLAAKLRLDGVDAPLPCEAVLDERSSRGLAGDRTLHLSTTLPHLRLDRSVSVVLGDHDELETPGVISRIALDPAQADGVPRLSLDVELAGRLDPRGAGAARNDGGDAESAPPSGLPAPHGHPAPSVMISKTLEREALARAAGAGRPRPPHRSGVTAEIARPRRFTDWTPPPALAAHGPRPRNLAQRVCATAVAHRPLLTEPRPRSPLWPWRHLFLVLPAAVVLATLLLRAGL